MSILADVLHTGMLAWYCRLYVCLSDRLSVMLYTVYKRYILRQNCPNKWIENAPGKDDFTTFNPLSWPWAPKSFAICNDGMELSHASKETGIKRRFPFEAVPVIK